ncbi:MAG TPA: HAMP domain-containing sensor histidine kinase [Ignavibacteriaceae bacterium]|nr:HAMP domain-containing sensor histidine kinase [Ignavibacteriaceae bacterium]
MKKIKKKPDYKPHISLPNISIQFRLQLKSANADLEELNKKLKVLNELKTNFFTNVSHELRTPLALTLGPVEKLLSQKDFSNYYGRDLRVIQQNARIMLKHVNNLLDLSKLELGKMQMNYAEIDLAHLVRVTSSFFESLAGEKDIYYNIEVPDSLYMQADSEKIVRVLINLLSNAFKFTPNEGTISCILTKEKSNAILKLIDSGPGIKSELKDTLFKRFKAAERGLTKHLGSTGHGLPIVKEIIELHNGIIEGENSREGGAIFSFTIPLTAPEGTIIQGSRIVVEDEIKNIVESFDILNTETYDEDDNINV